MKLDKPIFTGAAVAIVTPFDQYGNINYPKLAELIEYQIAHSTDAIVICGTTGESAALDMVEHIKAIEFAIKQVDHRVPVIAGTGSNDTAVAVKLSNQAEAAGADALLVVTPYYNKTSQDGLVPLQVHRRPSFPPHHRLQRPEPHRRQHQAGDVCPSGGH